MGCADTNSVGTFMSSLVSNKYNLKISPFNKLQYLNIHSVQYEVLIFIECSPELFMAFQISYLHLYAYLTKNQPDKIGFSNLPTVPSIAGRAMAQDPI